VAARSAPVFAYLAALTAAVSWAGGTTWLRSNPVGCTPVTAAAVQMCVAGAAMTVFAMASGEAKHWGPSQRSIVALTYLVLVSTCIAHSAFYWLMREVSPALLGTHAYANLAIATLLGWLLLGETLTPTQVSGTFLILLSVILTARQSRPTSRREDPERPSVASEQVLAG